MNAKLKDNQSQQAVVSLHVIGIIGLLCSFFFLLAGNMDFYGGFLLLFLSTIVFSIILRRTNHNLTPITIGFILRISICLIYTFKGDGDVDYYGVYAASYAGMPFDEVFMNIPTGSYLYSWIISFLFRLFGVNYMPVRVLNSFVSSLCVIIVGDIIDEIYKDRAVTDNSLWIIAFFPNLIRFSSLFANREVFLLFFMLLYIKHSYLYFEKGSLTHLFLSVIYLTPAMILHTSMIAMMILTVLIILNRQNVSEKISSVILIKLILIVAIVCIFTYMLNGGVGTEKFKLAGDNISIQSVSELGNQSAEGRAAYLKGVSFSNPVINTLFIPVRMIFFLFTPFPWMIRTPIDIVGFFDAMLYIWVLIPILRQLNFLIKNKEKNECDKFKLMMTIALICIIAMFAAVTSNYGTAIRHRCKLFCIMLIISAPNLRIPFTFRRR